MLDQGFTNLTVLDISEAALSQTRARLGDRAARVVWIEADITQAALPRDYYDLWHDRAVFHFLTDARQRRDYLRTAAASLKPGGHLIIATFALDGPEQCSGLMTARYSAEELAAALGGDFTLIASSGEVHSTPFRTHQKFNYCHFIYSP